MENNMPTVKEMRDAMELCNPNDKVELRIDCRQCLTDEKPSETIVLNLNSKHKAILEYIARW
jgi:hypothetical protein